jgi:hypothetical protein
MSSKQQRESIKCRAHNYMLVSSKLFVPPNRQLLARIYMRKCTVQLTGCKQSEFFFYRFSVENNTPVTYVENVVPLL